MGVELDEPKGKNNGVVQGKTYFLARDNYGLFVRHNQIVVSVANDPYPLLLITVGYTISEWWGGPSQEVPR